MSVRIEGASIWLEGECGVEDAEPLAGALEGGAVTAVDLSLCRHLHSAVVQALLSFPVRLEGAPADGFLTRFVVPALVEAGARAAQFGRRDEISMERPQ